MRNNQNQDGNFEYKYLKLPISTRRKRRFVRFLEMNDFYRYDGYEIILHLPTRYAYSAENLYEVFLYLTTKIKKYDFQDNRSRR